MPSFLRIAGFSLLVCSTIVLAAGFGFVYTAKQHTDEVITFWGELYDETDNDTSIFGGIAGAFLPSGGPLISTSLIRQCDDTPLPMVPIRFSDTPSLEVLCGLGSKSYVTEVDITEIGDSEMQSYLVEAFEKEYGVAISH